MSLKYRPEIDGLRALAIVPVIIFHSGLKIAPGGFIGVDIFFVISGYLISHIIFKEISLGKFSIIHFYERRARRILPALFFILFLTIISSLFFFSNPQDYQELFQSILSVLFFISNIFFWQKSNYFETSTELKPLLHTWSLGVEEQFYIFFPIIIVGALKYYKTKLNTILFLLFAISLTISVWATTRMPSASFYLLPTRAWEIFAGVLISRISEIKVREKAHNKGIQNILTLLGLCLILASIILIDSTIPWPGLYAIFPVLGAILIIIYSDGRDLVGKVLSSEILVKIGLVSYSAYLLHQPVFAFSKRITYGKEEFWLILMLIILIFVLSYFSYRLIEQPFRNKTRFNQVEIFKYSISGIIIFTTLSLYGSFSDNFNSKNRELIEAINDWEHPGNLIPTDINGFYKLRSEPIEILFFGDSHAEQYTPILEYIGAENELNIGILGGGGCPPIPNVYEEKHPHCKDIIERLRLIMEQEKSLKKIVLAACFNCYFIDQSNRNESNPKYSYYVLDKEKKSLFFRYDNDSQKVALNNFNEFLSDISKKYELTLLGDNPMGSYFDPVILNSIKNRYFYQKYPELKNNFVTPTLEEITLNQSLKEIAKSNNANFVDILNLICPENECFNLINDKYIYKDNSHLRPFFIKDSLQPWLIEKIFSEKSFN